MMCTRKTHVSLIVFLPAGEKEGGTIDSKQKRTAGQQGSLGESMNKRLEKLACNSFDFTRTCSLYSASNVCRVCGARGCVHAKKM